MFNLLETPLSQQSNPTLSSSYVREAKIYDEGMVARWKVLMDGLLLFAALFSAVVTAFIIESYKNLSPDSSAMTVILLYHISQQLTTIMNSTELNVALPDFSTGIPKLAVITNVFWFLSLALSLTCALTATLIEQWASDYMRTIQRREAPEIQARIRAYLFEGIRNSNVVAIVEGTPLLLHASLFSFFIGLVFFLHPINTAMTFLSAGILAAFATAYLSATVSPLIDTASPIRTPLTTLILQFSLARNCVQKISLCGLKLCALVQSQTRQGARAALKKLALAIAEIRQPVANCLANLTAWFQRSRMIMSSNETVELQPSSEIEELRAPDITLPKQHFSVWLEPFKKIWLDKTLDGSDLDAIQETIALDPRVPEFYQREVDTLFWTLQQ
ncbi:hypothetical protein C8J56DRAFT_861573, partial [Mycena floridula]